MKSIYIRNDDLMDFLAWISEVLDEEKAELVGEVGESFKEQSDSLFDLKETVYETFLEEDLTYDVVAKLQSNVTKFISQVKDHPLTDQAVKALAKRNKMVADHSINVANLSVYLGMALGHGHQFILENLYLGSIFHDYGKAKISSEVMENNTNSLYSQAIQDHPEKGVKIIRKTKGIPDHVFKIILQHHEQVNGCGYPAGLEGEEFYELAQIVSIANTFDNKLNEFKNSPDSEKYKKALKYIEINIGRIWDEKFFPRALEALELAFS